MPDNLVAILFALASALTIAWGTVVRHDIVGEAPADGTLRGSPLLTALRRPLWWIATGSALVAYGLQIVALGFGTLLIVQPILVLSLMFTISLAAKKSGRRVHGHEMFWAAVLTVAVTLLVVLGRPLPGDPDPPLWRWLTAGGVGAVVIGALLLAARGGRSRRRAILLGLVTGATFGVVAVLSKAFVDNAVADGMAGVLAGWETYALILAAAAGTAVQQYSFHAGPLSHSLPAMTIGEPIVAFGLGYFVLGERFQVTTPLGWALMGLALVAMILSTAALSRRGV